MSEVRILIDYATGENWEMPKELYERFLRFNTNNVTLSKHLVIEQWMAMLSDEDRFSVIKN